MGYIFSSESVAKGHPDKVADYISDSILDYCLENDPNSRCAIEVAINDKTVFVLGEVNTKTNMSNDKIIEIVKQAITFCGYDDPVFQFDLNKVKYLIQLNQQSNDIAIGVDESDTKEQGAGDQGIMFGYAKDDTDTLLPLPIYLSHKLMERHAYVREQGIIKGLGPDAKAQVSVKYGKNNTPLAVTTVVLSTQHLAEKSLDEVKEDVIKHIILPTIPNHLLVKTEYLINPTGRFVTGGPKGDSGLTGRKIIVDTYGGFAHHGGGAFSGKDASKVDRSATYMARYLAKQVVGSGLAKSCEIQLAYAIGVAKPVSVYVNTFKTGKVPDEIIEEVINDNFDLTPKGIINKLNLKLPIYKKTTHFGHFGKIGDEYTWETLDSIDIFTDLL